MVTRSLKTRLETWTKQGSSPMDAEGPQAADLKPPDSQWGSTSLPKDECPFCPSGHWEVISLSEVCGR